MSRAQSFLGRCWPIANLPEGCVLAVLKSYYDRSGQAENSLMTLAGVATNDSAWGAIESHWNAILLDRDPPATYFHSVEASGLRGEFKKDKGWDDIKVEQLTSDLLVYLTTLDQDTYCQFSVTLNMDDYRNLQAKTYQMNSPAEICTDYCTDWIMDWYVSKYKGLDFEAAFFFDQGEPFEPIFRAKWEDETGKTRRTGIHSSWSHIVQVASVCKEKAPGVQIADMFAWGVNRVLCGNSRFAHMAPAMAAFLNSTSRSLGEEYLRKRFRPLLWM